MTDPQTTMNNAEAPLLAYFEGIMFRRFKPVGSERTGEFFQLTINGWRYVRA